MSQKNVSVVPRARTALQPISEEAGRRRALDERLFVRAPGLARVLHKWFCGCLGSLGFAG